MTDILKDKLNEEDVRQRILRSGDKIADKYAHLAKRARNQDMQELLMERIVDSPQRGLTMSMASDLSTFLKYPHFEE